MTAIGVGPTASGDGAAVRPFRVNVSEPDLTELCRRITATRWPERERVMTTRRASRWRWLRNSLANWASQYDWRTCETKLNALPQFVTEIDGLDIHFIHARSRHDDALR